MSINDHAAKKALMEISLKGTPKQIAWALDIKDRMLDGFEFWLFVTDDALMSLITEYLSNDSAKWWIDNRDNFSFAWLQAQLTEIQKEKAL